ncbi:MAG TPA: hypothetical protein VNB54_14845, partial [Alphaproteobacteria bacterium]|nr:hypothetical protein [Alphaproteobacteria bacterium]
NHVFSMLSYRTRRVSGESPWATASMAAGNGLFSKSGWPCAGDGPDWAVFWVEGPPLVSSTRRIQVDHLATEIFRKLMTEEDYIKKRQRRQSGVLFGAEDTHFL